MLCGLFEFYIGPWDWKEHQRLVPCKWNDMELLALTLAIVSLFLFRVQFCVSVELEVCSSKWLCGQKYISQIIVVSPSIGMRRRIKLLRFGSQPYCGKRGLHNWRKPWAILCRTIQDGQVILKSSDKVWPTGRGNGKPLQYYFHKNPMDSIKRQKYMTLGDETPRLRRCSICYWQEWRATTNSSRKKEVAGSKQN